MLSESTSQQGADLANAQTADGIRSVGSDSAEDDSVSNPYAAAGNEEDTGPVTPPFVARGTTMQELEDEVDPKDSPDAQGLKRSLADPEDVQPQSRMRVSEDGKYVACVGDDVDCEIMDIDNAEDMPPSRISNDGTMGVLGTSDAGGSHRAPDIGAVVPVIDSAAQEASNVMARDETAVYPAPTTVAAGPSADIVGSEVIPSTDEIQGTDEIAVDGVLPPDPDVRDDGPTEESVHALLQWCATMSNEFVLVNVEVQRFRDDTFKYVIRLTPSAECCDILIRARGDLPTTPADRSRIVKIIELPRVNDPNAASKLERNAASFRFVEEFLLFLRLFCRRPVGKVSQELTLAESIIAFARASPHHGLLDVMIRLFVASMDVAQGENGIVYSAADRRDPGDPDIFDFFGDGDDNEWFFGGWGPDGGGHDNHGFSDNEFSDNDDEAAERMACHAAVRAALLPMMLEIRRRANEARRSIAWDLDEFLRHSTACAVGRLRTDIEEKIRVAQHDIIDIGGHLCVLRLFIVRVNDELRTKILRIFAQEPFASATRMAPSNTMVTDALYAEVMRNFFLNQ